MTSNSIQRIVRAYRKAMTASRRKPFFIESSIQQLEILQSLEMRHEYVSAAIQVLKEERARIHKEEYAEDVEEVEKVSENDHNGGRVFLFSGYSLKSLKGLAKYCNFPDNIEEVVRREIDRLLDEYEVTSDDLAITAGMAAGGDLIFIESCVARNIPVGTHMPVPEPQYVRDFVSPAGEDWVERFYKMRNQHHVDEYYQTDLVGSPKSGDDVFERNNRWALYSAMTCGIDNLRLIALFDDKHGVIHDTKDNNIVRHMIDLTRDAGGQVEIISPSKLILSAQTVAQKKNRTSSKKKEVLAEKTQEASSN